MFVFDLREEARLISYLYLVGGLATVLAVLTPPPLRRLLPSALADSVRPLAVIFALVAAGLAWIEVDERRQAEALVARCLAGGCTMIEGAVSDVEPVHEVTSGGRLNAPLRKGYFRVDGTLIGHVPRDHSDYSPANLLRDGDRVRAHLADDLLVLVEALDRPR